MRYIGPGHVQGAVEAEETFERALEHWRLHAFGWRSALERRSGEWVGFVGLNRVGAGTTGVAENAVEIGWWIVRSRWGRGYASEGAAALRDEAFGRLGLERIVARVQPRNAASARVAQKLGMTLWLETTGKRGEPLHVYALEAAARR